MLGAAEILRYTSTQTPALMWTDDDTAKFTNNLVMPVVQIFNRCNCRFMNQHLYTTLAAMSGYIFAENREKYNGAVEWFTVNKDAVDQGQNGAIKRLFRMVTRNDLTGEDVTPAVQHVEMGRDLAHAGGDITDAEIIARLMMAQGTKVDPVKGTVSTKDNAVGPYEFLNDRILDAAELYATYMIGYEIPWGPTASHTDETGKPTIVYKNVSKAYRGRSSLNYWELFYYYQYPQGDSMGIVVIGCGASVEATAAGIGVAELPCYRADTEPELVQIMPEHSASFKVWLVAHADLYKTARIQALIGALVAQFDSTAP